MFNLDDYETVEERLTKFWKDHPEGRIETKLIEHSSSRFIVWSAIFRDSADINPWSTGLAEETVSGRGVNATSALENCETSSIGRSLATAGYATKGKRPSREEMAKVTAAAQVTQTIQQTKAKMADTSKEYIPVEKASDPWTIQTAAPVTTMEQAVETVKAVLGGTATDESCIHGARVWKTGTTKAGNKPWGHWKCMAQILGDAERCDPIWYEIDKETGQWKPQVKR